MGDHRRLTATGAWPLGATSTASDSASYLLLPSGPLGRAANSDGGRSRINPRMRLSKLVPASQACRATMLLVRRRDSITKFAREVFPRARSDYNTTCSCSSRSAWRMRCNSASRPTRCRRPTFGWVGVNTSPGDKVRMGRWLSNGPFEAAERDSADDLITGSRPEASFLVR